jgi:hypothetical protein
MALYTFATNRSFCTLSIARSSRYNAAARQKGRKMSVYVSTAATKGEYS